MSGYFDNANWILAYNFLTVGDPPLITQMLVLNTVFLVLWMIRRMRGARAMRSYSANLIQGLLIVANCLVLLNGDFKFWDFERIMFYFS